MPQLLTNTEVTYCPHNYWLKFAQLMLGNQFAMWLGKLNCPSVGNPSDFTQLYNCPTVGYTFSWVTTCPTNFTQLDIAQPCTCPTFLSKFYPTVGQSVAQLLGKPN